MVNTRLFFGAATAVAIGCQSITGRDPVCTTDVRPGLVVSVLDSASRDPLGPGMLVVVRDGAYADTARTFLPHPIEGVLQRFAFAFERRGTYDVTVERSGYRTWRRDGVRVSGDECHVRTVELTALLQPSPWRERAGGV